MGRFRMILFGAILLPYGSFGFAPSNGSHRGGSRAIASQNIIGRRAVEPANNAKAESAASDKSNEEVNFITTAILQNSLFSGLPETSLKLLVDGFELSETRRGVELVTQGDSCTGDYVYLVRDGKCKVIIDGQV